MAILDGSIFDRSPDDAVYGFRRQKWIFWGGCYGLRRDVSEWLAEQPAARLTGWNDEIHIGPEILLNMQPDGKITMETSGFLHSRDPENPIPAEGARALHLGGYPDDLVTREKAAIAFHSILDCATKLPFNTTVCNATI